MRPVAVLRPEPGNAATAARLAAIGRQVIRLPLFAVRPLAWTPPDPADHDALLLTSANTLRHGGAGLAALRALPALTVGEATAQAARRAGFAVALTGSGDAAALLALAEARGYRHLLHLGGRERTVDAGGAIARAIDVYASEAIAPAMDGIAQLAGSIALLHSARAAARLAALVAPEDRPAILLAAIGPAVATAAGGGWGGVAVADAPDDAALLATLRALD